MTIKHHKSKARAAVKTLAAAAALTIGGSPFFTSAVRAADPYDAALEKRVEALERELNLMENDSKGKNVQADNSAVPTFLKAAGSNVQQLTISGDSGYAVTPVALTTSTGGTVVETCIGIRRVTPVQSDAAHTI